MSSCVLYKGDCLEVMPRLGAGSVDMVFADLPYGTTQNKWDVVIDLKRFWVMIEQIVNKSYTLAATAMQPFSTVFVSAKMESFRYALVWEKTRCTGFLNARRRPLQAHEDILIFGSSKTYNPQNLVPVNVNNARKKKQGNGNYGNVSSRPYIQTQGNFPKSILRYKHAVKSIHPTQKPVALLEWLIKTYTNEGDTVLDPVFGSNTTAIACARLGRNYIGIEKDAEYFRIGAERVNKERLALGLGEAVTCE